MLGAYRFYLAMMVLAQHAGGAWGLGGFAVYGFFVLSGYLMTYVMHNTYGFSSYGFKRYSLNRFLRIYPLYWLSCLLAVLVMLTVSSDTTARLSGGMGIPKSLSGILANLAITMSHATQPPILSQSWTLSVELFFYILIGLSISRTLFVTKLWFFFSVLYVVIVNIMGLGGEYTYYSLAAASLPFSVGAMIYHYKDNIDKLNPILENKYICFILAMLQVVVWLITKITGNKMDYIFFLYISVALHSLTIASLLRIKPNPIFNLKLDSILGKFSYPIYLTHLLMTVLIADIFFFGQYQSPMLLLFVTPPVIAVSWLLIWIIEEPIDRMRRRVKSNLPNPR